MNDSTSIRSVNLLFLVVFLTLFVGSLLMPPLSLGWRVVINELVLLALPLMLYLVMMSPSLRHTLRLRGVSWQIAGLSLLIGLGLWHVDAWVGSAILEALDYVIPLPPEALNVTLLDNVAMIVGTVALAPVVEELLFRGVLQSTYERSGPVRAIAGSTLLFVLIHQELAQSIALVPVALALGYVVWRTQSIVPGMLIHLIYNAQAILVSFVVEGRAQRLAFAPSPLTALGGGVVAGGALWLLTRRTSATRKRERGPSRRGWLARSWPVFPVVPIYGVVIGLGVLIGARPEALALGQRVELASGPWEEETVWRYEIRNALDEPVGEAECALKADASSWVLDCSMEQSAYEADDRTGFFKEGDVTQRQTVRWERETLAPGEVEIAGVFSQGEDRVTLDARVENGVMSVRVDRAAEPERAFDLCYRLDGNAGGEPPADEPCRVDGTFLAGGGASSPLMAGEWPWRLSALPFELAYSRKATLLWPYRSVTGADGRAPVKEDVFVVVRTAEQLTTPAGEFITWRVAVGERQTAWYTVEEPHHLVAYSDNMVTWQLMDVE